MQIVLIALAIFCIHAVSCLKPLDDEALSAIMIGRDQILSKTKPEDLLVFAGNSASYFYHAVKTRRESFLVPFSGHYPLSQLSKEYRAEVLHRYQAGFEQTFVAPFTNIAIASNRRIVLIDHYRLSLKVDGFDELVKFTCADCITVFLPLQIQTLQEERIQMRVPVTGIVCVPDIAHRLFLFVFVQLTPYFPKDKWGRSSPSIMSEYELQPQVEKAIEQISQMSEKVPPTEIIAACKNGFWSRTFGRWTS